MVPATSSPRQSAARRSQRRTRLALALGALVFAAGLIALVEATTDKGPAPTTSSASPAVSGQAAAAPEPRMRKGGKLVGEARRVAQSFLVAALGRTNLAEAWDLATPELRGGVTRSQWLAGEMPIPPYPIESLETTGYQVLESSPTRMLLQVLLVPKADSGYTPIRYDMTIGRPSTAAGWKVSYLLPYAPLGMNAYNGS